ncbi:MAG TPA: DoxX family protein [Oligoflexia bacterium]|nr:DoxX family protein [Oligoflexia bacterium]HMR25669.1 DoxX family protein [Oligoflexia bacterium]
MKYLFRIIPAVILLQTLFFKFTGAPESIYIFSTLGVEPWGRYLSGIAELLAAILILIPATTYYGSLLTLMIMLGAIASHILFLGITVQNDGGLLFMLACITFLCARLNIYYLKK